jgi:signal transduction histidine kinase/ActR/RegA family two-component response regulator
VDKRSGAARLRLRVVWTGIGIIALIIAADAYTGWQDYRAAVGRCQQTVELLSRALADQTARMVQELDFALDDFSDWNSMGTGEAAPSEMRGELLTHIVRLPYVHSAFVFGPDGTLVATTESGVPTGTNIAGNPIFTVPQLSATDQLYISTTKVSPRDGYQSFSVSRRLHDPTGRFAGVVIVRVAFEYLARFYATVDASPGASIRLIRSDGADLAHYPTAGDGLPQRPVSRQTVAGYPLVVEVASNLDRALVPWREMEQANAVRTLVLSTLAALLLAALATALRHREEADAARLVTEARLQEARRAEALSLLAASVAHDFNNVLSAIVGYAELARRDAEHWSPAVANIDLLLAAAERARQLVRKVLTFDPHRSLNYTNVPLVPVIREVLDQLQATLPAGIAIDLSIGGVSAEVLGDATEIHQVIMNLCTNAVHAMPGGGVLAVRLAPASVPTPRVLAVGRLEPGEWWCLSISDQGGGMPSGEHGAIFEALYTTKSADRGTGIGLAVVRNIVMSMRGAVDVESAPQAGARFSVYWRRADKEHAMGPRGCADEGYRGHGQTLLIVDDEPQLVALVEEMAASLGYEPAGFSNPMRALAAIRRNPDRFDAVVTDERMAALRGTAFAEAIHEIRPLLPVVLLTAYRSAQLDLEAQRCGVLDVLDKPVRLNELSRVLGDVFRRVNDQRISLAGLPQL